MKIGLPILLLVGIAAGACALFGKANAEPEQGVRGRVVLRGGGPAPGVAVYLLPRVKLDPLALVLIHLKHQQTRPVAQTETGADGRFAIGIAEPDASYELRIVSQDCPEVGLRPISVRSGDWYDAHDIGLEPGGVVQGRVIDEVSLLGIVGARVFLTVPGLEHQLLPAPGRERGIVAVTDGNGAFRFTGAPRDGLVTLGAEADAYAYGQADIRIEADTPAEQTLELARGERIAGIAVDQHGQAVANATVGAIALSAKLLQSCTTTTSDGRFELLMLRPGPYQLVASAENFEGSTAQPVVTNDLEVKLVLEQRARARLRVRSARGTPLRNYVVALRRSRADTQGTIVRVPQFRDVLVTPADHDGDYAIIRNLPKGEFVFQIAEPNHCLTQSPPFSIATGHEPPVVEVTLTIGASITGIVVDELGQPVAGAVVATDVLAGGSVPPLNYTAKTTRTDGSGCFALSQLAFADYALRVVHPDFCEGTALHVKVDTDGQTRDAGSIALSRGCVVEGFCSRAGVRTGQIRVTIEPPIGAEFDQSGQPERRFSASTTSQYDGHYRLARVPPGTYLITSEENPSALFNGVRQMNQRELVIRVGQEQATVDFDVRDP